MLSPIVKALKNKFEMNNANSSYFHHSVQNLLESDGLLYMVEKLVIPITLRKTMIKTLHEKQTNQFRMKYLAQSIWWPHISRQTYFHGINFSECTKMGKNLKSIIPNSQNNKLPLYLNRTKITAYTLLVLLILTAASAKFQNFHRQNLFQLHHQKEFLQD